MRTRQMMAIVALGLAVAGFGALQMGEPGRQETPVAERATSWHWIDPPQRLGGSGPFQPLIDSMAHWL